MRKLFAITCSLAGICLAHQMAEHEFMNSASAQIPVAETRTLNPVEESISDKMSGKSQSQAANTQELFQTYLAEAERKIQGIDRYHATLEKQVRLDGVLQDVEWLDVKIRHEPFSVFLRWHCDEQEALYVEGENDNRLLVRPTRGLAALKGVWNLKPDSPQALKGNRYPVTQIGLLELTQRVKSYYEKHRDALKACVCEQELVEYDSQPAMKFKLVFSGPDVCEYSCCEYTFDAESKLLMAVELCEWDYNGKPDGIAESYKYHDLNLEEGPTDDEFNPSYPEYSLVKK